MLTETEIEAMSEEERARHLAEFDARLDAANERARQNNLRLEEKVKRLEALADEQEKIAAAMEQLAEQSRHIRAERDSLLAA